MVGFNFCPKRFLIMKFLPLMLFLFCTDTFAQDNFRKNVGGFNLEILNTTATYNYFSLPNENETNRVDLPELSGTKYRLFYEKIFEKYSVTFLYAPLDLNYLFNSSRDFKFNNTNFNTNTNTEVFYKFNSYRIGFRNNNFFSFGRYYYGALLKIRDAEICVKQNSLKDCYDNIGPVPLLNLGIDFIGDTYYFSFNMDGLFSSRGSAYDANLEFGYQFSLFRLGIGYRVLGGGADSDKLINFGQFQSSYLSIKF